MEINTEQTLEDIFKLSPEERQKQFRKDEKVIADLLLEFSNKYKGYLVGVSISKFPQTFDWAIGCTMDNKLITDEVARYQGDKL